MREWEKLSRSLRLVDKGLGVELNVWHVFQIGWKWNVSRLADGVYTAAGIEQSEDSACEHAMLAAGI